MGKEFPIRKESGKEGNTHIPIRFYPGTDRHREEQSQDGKDYWNNQVAATERTLQGRMEEKTIDAGKTMGRATDIFSKNKMATPEKEEGARMNTHRNDRQPRFGRNREGELNQDLEITHGNRQRRGGRNKLYAKLYANRDR